MTRYRCLWSAALTIIAAANCAVAQPAPTSTAEGSDSVPVRADLAQPAPYVIDPIDDLAPKILPQLRPEPSESLASAHYVQERMLQPQPAFSRKARIVFEAQRSDEFEPAPEYSRAARVVIAPAR